MPSLSKQQLDRRVIETVIDDIQEHNPRGWAELHNVTARLEEEYGFGVLRDAIRPMRLGSLALAFDKAPWPEEASKDVAKAIVDTIRPGILMGGVVTATEILINAQKEGYSAKAQIEASDVLHDVSTRWVDRLRSQDDYVPKLETTMAIAKYEHGALPEHVEKALRFIMHEDRQKMLSIPVRENPAQALFASLVPGLT